MAADPSEPPRVIRARSEGMFRWFGKYSRRFLRRGFHAVRILKGAEPDRETEGPRVIFCNHPSWNDPLVLIYLAHTFFPDREHYGPIDSKALQGYGFFQKLGFFGVNRESLSGAREFLRTAEAIFRRGNTVFWITAEGHFTDVRCRPVQLQPGLGTAIQRCEGELTVTPLAIEYSFGEERYPEIFLAFGEAIEPGSEAPLTPEIWTQHCAAGLEAAQDRLSAAVIERDLDKFEDLIGGAAGVGGIYGMWNRLKALFTGKKFDPRHGALTESRDDH